MKGKQKKTRKPKKTTCSEKICLGWSPSLIDIEGIPRQLQRVGWCPWHNGRIHRLNLSSQTIPWRSFLKRRPTGGSGFGSRFGFQNFEKNKLKSKCSRGYMYVVTRCRKNTSMASMATSRRCPLRKIHQISMSWYVMVWQPPVRNYSTLSQYATTFMVTSHYFIFQPSLRSPN